MRYPAGRLSLLLCLLVPACAATSEEEDLADGADEVISGAQLEHAKVAEKGRFRHEGKVSAEQDGATALAWRLNGFGATKVRIKITPKASSFAPTLVLAGPIPGSENQVVLQKRGTRAGGLEIETTLKDRGAYRLLVGTQAGLAGRRGDAGGFDLEMTCLSNCDLPEVTLADVLADLKAKHGEAKVAGAIDQLLAAHVGDADLRGKISTQLLAIVHGTADPNGAVPVIPMSLLGVAQGLFEHAPVSASSPPRVEAPRAIDVELADVGKDCKVTRPAAAHDLSPSIPGLAIADAPDYTYDDCALARLEGLASAMNALALENGSVVRDGAARYGTVRALAAALAQQGHHIVMDNSRYYADFLGLSYEGKTVRAPVWMDTGIALPGGGTLKTPAPHAHHNIWITGPRFDGQLKFYMGVDGGTSFRVQSTIGRRWSGGKAEYTIDGASRLEDVLVLLETAGALRKKWQAAGASLPMLGYGRLGVCTDSTAVLEHRLRGTVTLFPLAHPKTTAASDAIDRELGALPSDLGAVDRDDALRRIGATIPFAHLEDDPFPAFVTAWRSLGGAQ